MLDAFNAILGTVTSITEAYKTEAIALVIALALIMSIIRAFHVLIVQGYDQFIPAVKKQLMALMVVVFLCLPIFPSGGSNESFLTYFPQTIIRGGFGTANKLLSSNNNDAFGTSHENDVALIPSGLSQTLDRLLAASAAGATTEGEFRAEMAKLKTAAKKGWWSRIASALTGEIFMTLIVAGALFVILIGFLIISTFGIGFILALVSCGGVIFTFIWFTCTMFADLIIEPDGSTAAAGFSTLANMVWSLLTVPIMNVIFVNIVTFAFYGVMISCIVKAVIFCVTFPLSVVTMAFEHSKTVFISNIQKGISIAITPLIAAGIYAIVIMSYVTLIKSDPEGLVYKMLHAYIYPSGVPLDGIADFFKLLIRWMIATFVGPTVLCLPIAKYIVQSPRIASDLIGAGVSYGSGLSDKAARIGSFGLG